MKYGEIQYRETRQLHRPNIIVGRSSRGDWVDRFDRAETSISEDEVIIEGYDPIGEYVESALERYEDNVDIQAGLVAIQILHHYRERFGDTTDAMNGALLTGLLADSRPDSSKFILAIEAHPAIAAKLREVMHERALQTSSIWAAAQDRHLVAYLEAISEDENLDGSLKQLQQLRGE